MVLKNVCESLTFVNVFLTLMFMIIVWTLKNLIENRHLFRFAKKYKGYNFYPFIGNLHHVIGKDIFTAIQEIVNQFGLPCNLWLGHDYYYITADAAEIKIILNHPNSFDKMKAYENLKLTFNNTLLIAPVDLWKRRRKFYSRSFSQPILNNFVQYFYKKSSSLLEVLKNAEHKDVFEIFEKYTLDSFCESVIGIDYDLQVNPKIKIIEWMGKLQQIGGSRILTYKYYPVLVWLMSNEGRTGMKLVKKIRKFIYDIIRQKRKAFAENPVCADNTLLPLLDSMLQAEGEKFTDKQIFQEMVLFTTAATDTSGYTLAYTMTFLGMYPEIQEKVYQEVLSVIGKDRPIYHEDLPNLKYTERVILESMRIISVTPLIGRYTTADIDLGAKVLPKGANVIISTFNLQRNEKYWPEPLKYDPDRFLPEEVAKREPYTWIPFSGGPRNCIGKTYSIMLMKTAVANVIRNFKIFSNYKSVSDMSFTSCITMKTAHPLDCRFSLRNQH